jgi:hypothetical protein
MKRRRLLVVVVIVLVPLAVHAIWDQAESTLLAREISALARRGEPVNVVANRLPLASAEQRQAAALYAAAAGLARWQSRDDNYTMTAKDVESRTADPRLEAARLDEYLARAAPALALLKTATSLDFAGFSDIAPELHTNQSSLETLSGMSNLSADIHSVRGEQDLATDTLIQSIRLQRTITITWYSYLSVARLYGSLRILLNHASPEPQALQRLQAAFEEWPDSDGLIAEMQRQRAQLLGTFWPYPADGASWALRPQLGYRAAAGEAGAFVIFRPLLTHVMRRQLGPFDEVVAVARQPWPGKMDSAQALAKRYNLEARRGGSRTFLNRAMGTITGEIGVWHLDSALPVGGMNLARRRTAIVVLAVERFRRAHQGQPPVSLDALVPQYLKAVPDDPFDGKPLKYRVDADNYVVYSVDINRTDDGGVFYGFGSGVAGPIRGFRDMSPRDIGIRVPLGVH